jgi:hypothetical protein
LRVPILVNQNIVVGRIRDDDLRARIGQFAKGRDGVAADDPVRFHGREDTQPRWIVPSLFLVCGFNMHVALQIWETGEP